MYQRDSGVFSVKANRNVKVIRVEIVIVIYWVLCDDSVVGWVGVYTGFITIYTRVCTTCSA